MFSRLNPKLLPQGTTIVFLSQINKRRLETNEVNKSLLIHAVAGLSTEMPL